jgi:CRP-like cAMP-binding protein
MKVTAKERDELKNHLLSALPELEFKNLEAKLEHIEFDLGHVIHESGDRMAYAYFPTTAIISLLYVMENGATAEIGVIGNEGVMGVAAVFGGISMPNRAIVQSAGGCYRMKVRDVDAEFVKGEVFQKLMLRFVQALMTQISQTAVCNRLHSVEQQLCRWLLLSHDRLDSNKLVMTHDLISNMLGVRREGVTVSARKLTKKKLIRNDRGTITILDRAGLEEAVCECYEVVNAEYNRLLGRGMSRSFN